MKTNCVFTLYNAWLHLLLITHCMHLILYIFFYYKFPFLLHSLIHLIDAFFFLIGSLKSSLSLYVASIISRLVHELTLPLGCFTLHDFLFTFWSPSLSLLWWQTPLSCELHHIVSLLLYTTFYSHSDHCHYLCFGDKHLCHMWISFIFQKFPGCLDMLEGRF